MNNFILFLTSIKKKINNINPFFLGIILFIIFLLLPLATYNYTTASGDIAEYINNPLRVINGELPYRDFWLMFPPGEVFLPAFIYKVFGLNVNILLFFSLFINVFIGIFSFLLGKEIFKDNFYSVILAILVFFNGITHYLGYTYIYMYFLLLLISSYFLIKYLNNNKITELFISGIFVGLAFLFRFYEVGAVFVSFLLVNFIHTKMRGIKFHQRIKSYIIFCCGVILVVGAISFALIEIWKPMVKEIMIESILHGTSMKIPYFTDSIPHIRLIIIDLKKILETGNFFYVINFSSHLAHFINVTLPYLFPFFIVGMSILYFIWGKLGENDKVIILFFLLWGIFTFPKSFGRADVAHLAFSNTPLFFVLIFLLKKSFEKFKENKNVLDKFVRNGLVIITILLLVPVFLFPVKTAFVLVKPHFKVSTKYGTLFFADELEAKYVNTVIEFINKNTNEKDYIFVTPWYAPPFYALTNRKNPTYYDSLIDVIVKPSDEKQSKICKALLDKKCKLIIHYADWGFDDKKQFHFLNACPILQKCIESNFELVKKYGHYWIYIAKKTNN